MSLQPRTFDDPSAAIEGLEKLLRRFEALTDQAPTTAAVAVTGVSGEPAFLVAAADAAPETKAVAHFKCDGVDDHVEIQQALDALPTAFNSGFDPPEYTHRGRVILSEGSFWPSTTGASTINVSTGKSLVGSGPGTALMIASSGYWDINILGSGITEVGNWSVDVTESE